MPQFSHLVFFYHLVFSNFHQTVIDAYKFIASTFHLNMRTGRGQNVSSHLFFLNILSRFWQTCLGFNNKSGVQIVVFSVKGSGHQVRSKSEHHGTTFEVQNSAVSTVLVWIIWNLQGKVWLCVSTKSISQISRFRDLRSSQFLTSSIISLWKIGTFLLINVEPVVENKWKRNQC